MLWLALHLPLLPLEAFCASLPPHTPGAAPRAVALIDQHRVHSVNPAAAACGIRPGMKRATALALAADLLVADRCAAREAAALQAVVHAALAYTPSVCLRGSAPARRSDGATVLLEVQGSLRLFGGLAQLCRLLLQALAPLGHRVQMAAAPTALGAALLAQLARPAPDAPSTTPSLPTATARPDITPPGITPPGTAAATAARASLAPGTWGGRATDLPALQALLGPAPVVLLDACRPHADVLLAMGVHTLADLQALPRAGVARRLGHAVLDELDRALGQQADPRRWLTLPPSFESRLELFTRAENTDQVLHGATVLLARLVAWAQARQARVGGFTLRMLHERQRHHGRGDTPPATELSVTLAEPALDPTHLQLLLRERLARCTLAAPTLELQLQCCHLVAAPAPNGELFPTAGSRSEGLVRLLERLSARLGAEQVYRVLPVADFRPEQSYTRVPAQGPLPAAAAAHAAAAVAASAAAAAAATVATAVSRGAQDAPPPLHRPAWLLPEPLPLAERHALPLLQGRALVLVSGPERIETGWWDAGTVARDYYIAMAEDGALVWIFCNRVPNTAGGVHWFLQGRFG